MYQKNTSKLAYAQGQGTVSTNGIILDIKDPTVNDTQYSIGQFWLNQPGLRLFYLVSQSNAQSPTNPAGYLQSTWEIISVGNVLATLSDTGNTVVDASLSTANPPDNIQLVGGTGISVVSNPALNLITISNTSPGSGTVTNVSGTAGQINVINNTTTPIVSIDPTYIGQTSITTLGTITAGTWNGTIISPAFGGTGVNNGAKTITLGGNLTTSGAFNSTFTMTGPTTVTFPTSGTLSTSTGTVTSVSGTANQVFVNPASPNPVISLIGPYTPSMYTTNGVLYGNGILSIGATAQGAANTVLLGNGGVPTFGTVPNAALTNSSITLSNGNNITVTGSPVSLGGTASFNLTGTTNNAVQIGNAAGSLTSLPVVNNGVLITSATGVPSLLPDGTNGQVLTATTGSPPTWGSIASTGAITTINSISPTGGGNFLLTGLTNSITVTPQTNGDQFSISATYPGQTSIITLGTVTTGVWNGTTIAVANGGTGQTTLTTNGILYGNAGSALGITAAGTTGTILTGNTGSAPTFQALSGLAATSITGTANQISASASTGAVTLSTPVTFIAPGSVASTTSLTAGNGFTVTTGTSNINGNALFKGPTPWADVVAYGADPTGVASSVAAFNAAIASLPLGGIVWVPIGTYKIDSAVTVSTAHIRFCGASRTDSILNNTGVTTNTINLNTFYGGCENLTFTAPANTNTAGFAIGMTTSSSFCYVWRCDFTNMYQGVNLLGNLAYIDDCGFRTASTAATGGCCVLLNSGASNNWIRKMTTTNAAAITGFSGISILNVGALLVSDCQLIGVTTAMSIAPSGANTTPSIEVVNTFFDTSTIGLSVAGTGTPARCKFTNCWFSNQTTAGIVFNNANMTGFTFDNCDIYGNGIGISALAATDWCIMNSRIAGNTTAGIQTTAAAAHSFMILGNTIGPTGVFGANGNGVNIQSGTYASYKIRDNIGLQGNTTAGITDSGVVANQNQKDVSNNLGATVKGLISANTSATGALNTTETIVVGGKAQNGATAVIPANSLQIGNVLRFTMHGTCTSSIANTSTFTLRMGTAGTGTTDASVATAVTSIAAVTGTAVGFTAILDFTVLTIGSTGTISGSMLLLNTGITGISANNTQSIPLTVTATLNTTTANYIEVTYKSAATTTTSTFQGGFIEVL